MRKLLLLAFATTAAVSCDVNYSPETRYAFKSHLDDANGNPLADVRTEIVASDGYDSEIISSGKTDANGDLLLVVPKVDNSGTYTIDYSPDNIQYRRLSIKNIPQTLFEDYTFVSHRQVDRISETVVLQLHYQSSGGRRLDGVSFQGLIGSQDVDYAIPDVNSGFQPPYSIYAYKNQTIQLTYTTFDYATQTTGTQTVSIAIADQNLTYTLNY